ncbi:MULTISPECIES: tagatose-bisphosphate aldolase [unclassified Streptococcus]|uniref:tagatose-bisphosphate aldolase n=1 Tax=unclassified Streptococcus TaxID=2608887 RepID=UPI00107219B9|nr:MULTISPECIES: tagatose-bisphosphate aldolase [unclassified Streptococcus]MBF0806063.1 tagatose-bisphosphate aldolase [Streptococcus sp. 19428wA2_WM07]TFU28359.1 tagatose-bisphosphate aldolase [Streptococcus sp. WM07]
MSKFNPSPTKIAALEKLADENGVIGALAIDQRGALQRMLSQGGQSLGVEGVVHFKELVSQELTPYASSILLDPEFGLPASRVRAEGAGLLLAYEKTGYDASEPGRFPDLIDDLSVLRIKEAGSDAVKLLLYYDVDEDAAINERKKAFVERVGSECLAEEIPFFLELLTYDAHLEDVSGAEFARLKPHKVNEAMREFSKDVYQVDVLKVEVPVNMNFVEGFSQGEVVYSKEEAVKAFQKQAQATHLPFIFLSAGVSAQLFQNTLYFAKEAGSNFNGVLCGRATWKDSVAIFAEQGESACREWLQTQGRKNIEDLNAVLAETAQSWKTKL